MVPEPGGQRPIDAALEQYQRYVYAAVPVQSEDDREVVEDLIEVFFDEHGTPLTKKVGPGGTIIVTIVVHHGASPWRAPRSLQALYDAPEDLLGELGPTILGQRLLLDDLAGISDEALSERALSVFADLTLRALARTRHLSAPEVGQEISRWLGLARAVASAPFGLQKLAARLHCPTLVSQVEEADLRDFARAIDPPLQVETTPTLAEKWMAEGREKGLEQGLEQGRANLLLRMLALKYSPLPVELTARVQRATRAEIDRWSERFITATSLDDVFGD